MMLIGPVIGGAAVAFLDFLSEACWVCNFQHRPQAAGSDTESEGSCQSDDIINGERK